VNITVSQATTMLQGLLSDDTLTTADTLDALNAAQEALAAHAPKRTETTITGDGTTASFSLPSDFYSLEALFDENGQRIYVFDPRDVEYIGSNVGSKVAYLRDGMINFLIIPDNGAKYKMLYAARWPELVNDTDTLGPPRHWLSAMLYYAGAYMLVPSSIDTANIRQFATDLDAGNPEHNPLARRVEFLRDLFEKEVARHASYIGGQR